MKGILDVEIIESKRFKAAVFNISTNTSRTFIAAIAAEIDTPEKAALISKAPEIPPEYFPFLLDHYVNVLN